MTKDTVIGFARPSDFSPDPLTDLLRAGAQELLATAVRAEVTEFMKGHAHLLDDEGRQRLVRHFGQGQGAFEALFKEGRAGC